MNSHRPINYFYRAVGSIAAGVFVLFPLSAIAAGLPTAGQVVAGSGSISESGNTLTVTQTSATMVADWQSFSIGQGNTVNFVQPSASAVALNRVMGTDVSVIQGALNANGQVFLVNPNGVLFTPTAQVNVGALVASSLELSTEDFLAGNYRFSGNSTAGVINQGDIKTTAGGTVALIAARIENTGSITAPEGKVLMGAGRKVRLDLGGPVKIEVEEGALNTLIEQGGAIRADGGLVYLTAKAAGDLASSVINHTGLTQARGIASNQQGEIYLMGDMAQGSLQVAGTLDAAAHEGQAGFIETSAHQVKIAEGVEVKGNQLLMKSVDFTISDGIEPKVGSGMGAATLSNVLAGGLDNVVIETVADGSENGDIFVNSAVAWNTPTKLTLSAHRNIEINADITAQHADGKLQLEYGQGVGNGYNSAVYSLNGGKINLQAGDNFFTKFGNWSDLISWKVITQLGSEGSTTGNDLQGIQGNLADKYVLGADIDADITKDWNNSAGFTPIGNDSNRFIGKFDGLGHTINNLTINRPGEDHIGLFGFAEKAEISNLGLVTSNVKGKNYVGGFVGWLEANEGYNASIFDSYIENSVIIANDYVGGLAGLMKGNSQPATVVNSYSAADLIGVSNVGGLVGKLEAKNHGMAGITNSYFFNNVNGKNNIGGLVGLLDIANYSYVDFIDSYSKGDVVGENKVGGLIGLLETKDKSLMKINNSYTVGDIVGKNKAGGLIGLLESINNDKIVINNSYVTGSVTGDYEVGGLIGLLKMQAIDNYPMEINNSYTAGVIVGENKVGGLIGLLETRYNSLIEVTNSYVVGSLIGIDKGGFAGVWNSDGGVFKISNSFWDVNTTSVVSDKVVGTVTGGTVDINNAGGKTTSEMQDIATFNTGGAAWAVELDNDYTGNYLYPRLTMSAGSPIWVIKGNSNTIVLNYTSQSFTGEYNGEDYLLESIWNAESVFGATYKDWQLGTDYVFKYKDMPIDKFFNADVYNNISVEVLKSGFSISGSPSTFTITPRPITITADTLSKIYGEPDPILTYVITAGHLVGNDVLTGSLSRISGDNTGGYSIDSNELSNSNYQITRVNSILTINPRPITITIDNLTKSLGYTDPTFTYKVTQGSLVSGNSLGGEAIGMDKYIPSSIGTSDKVESNSGSISMTDRNSVKSYSDLNLVRAEGEGMGEYVISADNLTNNNYLITKNNGTLKITSRPVVVSNFSQPNPSTYGLKGFYYLNMNVEQGGINLGGK